MVDTALPMRDLLAVFKRLDGQPYASYQRLMNKAYYTDRYHLHFVHLQGSPGAFPASVVRISISKAELGLDQHSLSNSMRQLATADYLLREFQAGISAHASQNRGALGSGSFQPLSMPPEVLKRNIVKFDKRDVQICCHISLPGSDDNRVLGLQAVGMFENELPGIIGTLKHSVGQITPLRKHCDIIEDMLALQCQLSQYGLVAFIGDGAILPRRSGVSTNPLKEGAIEFCAPHQLAIDVALPNAGRIRGLGIRPGVNVLIGGGFHGKTTLLDALVKGVYPHIPGDGRERVVTHSEALFVCAEEGRAVSGLDISGFIHDLPGAANAERYWTKDASGSVSQAAAIVEAVSVGAKLLLMDEDSSATNFLIKDHNMRQLIPEDTITPLFDRARELYDNFGVSTVIVVGGSSDYLGIADQVICMRNYKPACVTDALRQLALPKARKPTTPLMIKDKRRVLADNFNPEYTNQRLGITLSERIKPLRNQERILEYGNDQLDLTRLTALVDPQQVAALGYALSLARRKIQKELMSPSDLAESVCRMIDNQGLDILANTDPGSLFFARPRPLELAAAINRLRSLKVKIGESVPSRSGNN